MSDEPGQALGAADGSTEHVTRNAQSSEIGITNTAFLDETTTEAFQEDGFTGQGTAGEKDKDETLLTGNNGQQNGNQLKTESISENHAVDGSSAGQPGVPTKDGVWSTGSGMSVADVGSFADSDAEEHHARLQQQRDRDPLLYCKWVADYPAAFFGCTLGAHILLLLITAILVQVGYDILPITFDRLPLDIQDDPDFLRGLAWRERYKDDSIISGFVTTTAAGNATERSETGDILELLFHIPGGNVFTKENLKLMKEVEEDFLTNVEFSTKFCKLTTAGTCALPRSILRYFDGTFTPVTGDTAFNDPDFDNVLRVLQKANTYNETKKGFQYHLGKTAVINSTHAISEITRGLLFLGVPLQGYANDSDRENEQNDKIEKFMLNEFKIKAEAYYRTGVGPMEFLYNSGTLLGLTITSQVFKDMALALGSLCFIIIFVCIQTGSLWIAGWGIFSIITGFCGTNLLYRVLLDFRYFGIFHVLAVFIILGIGADDIFVFLDTWKESSHHHFKSLGHRLSYCYRKAALAMLFTSLTTGVAFVVSATSPFLGISTFGVFAGILVGVNYLSVIIFFPTVVITYHIWWEKYKCCCCGHRRVPAHNGVTQNGIGENQPAKDSHRRHPLVRFFRGPYYSFVTHKTLRWVILLVFAALISVFIYYSTQLKVNEEQTKFLPDNSNFGKYLALRSSGFTSTSESSTKVLIVWGLKPQNLDICHHTDPKCTGTLRWDDNFNLNSPEAQTAFLDLCSTLKSLPTSKTDELNIRRSIIDNTPEVQCFLDDMRDFFQAESERTGLGATPTYPLGTTFAFPINSSSVNILMQAFPLVYDTSKLSATFNRHFEVATSFWLYNGFRFSSVSGLELGTQLALYRDLLGEAINPPNTVEKSFGQGGFTYFYGTRLRYAAISINTTVESSTLGFPKGIPIRDAWENFVKQQISAMPSELRGGFQVSVSGPVGLNVWHWVKVQRALATSATQGIIIGICVALPILIIATQNVIVGFLATVTICLITVSVIGIIPMAGWKLGLLESLNLVLVVGLAVDYVVHLAEGYSRCLSPDRLGRTRSALEEVGVSVLSGAITTLGSSVFLLAAYILFFTQFGIFMFGTIGLSILYALGFFITLMGVIGPQGDTGSLKPLWRWCSAKCPGTKRETSAHDSAATT